MTQYNSLNVKLSNSQLNPNVGEMGGGGGGGGVVLLPPPVDFPLITQR